MSYTIYLFNAYHSLARLSKINDWKISSKMHKTHLEHNHNITLNTLVCHPTVLYKILNYSSSHTKLFKSLYNWNCNPKY